MALTRADGAPLTWPSATLSPFASLTGRGVSIEGSREKIRFETLRPRASGGEGAEGG